MRLRGKWLRRVSAVACLLIVAAAAFWYGSVHGASRQKMADAKSVAAAHAAIEQRSDNKLTIIGTIASVASKTVQIKTASTGTKTCVITTATMITTIGHSSTTATLQTGQRVLVTAVQDSHGTITAQRVRIL